AGLSRTQGWRLAGMGTDVSLDRSEDPCSRFLLHARYLAVAVRTPAGRAGMARTLHRTTTGPVETDTEVQPAVSPARRKGTKSPGHGSLQTIAYSASAHKGSRPRSAL